MTDPYEGTAMLWLNDMAYMTMRNKQLVVFLEATGGEIMVRGHLRTITVKHMGAGVYRVGTKKWEDK